MLYHLFREQKKATNTERESLNRLLELDKTDRVFIPSLKHYYSWGMEPSAEVKHTTHAKPHLLPNSFDSD